MLSPAKRLQARGGEDVAVDPCVYLLRCTDDSLYCGWTIDLPKRLAAHEAGTGAKYTRTRLPVTLAAAFPMADATAARKEEARIKALSRAQKLALIVQAKTSR